MEWTQLSLDHMYHPPVECIFHLVESHDGWFLRYSHRHPDGRYGDCPTDHYERLTLAEALDVICATLGLEEEPF